MLDVRPSGANGGWDAANNVYIAEEHQNVWGNWLGGNRQAFI